MATLQRRLRAAALAAGLACGLGMAQAGVLDFLFGGSKADTRPAEAAPANWYRLIGEFSEVRIVPAEAGSAANAHPANVSAQTLRQLLGAVRFKTAAAEEALFAADELDEIAGPTSEALRLAKPGDDVQLRSSSKRGGGLNTRPYAVTARLFVLGDRLNLIVGDPRADFYFRYRSTGKLPELGYGSRAAESTAKVAMQRLGVPGARGDWLEIPLSGEAAPMPAARVAAPAPPPAPAAAAAVAAPAAAPVPAPAPAPRVRDAAFAEEVEQRLGTLKRLRDKGLITEDEYQQKRREVLATL